MSLSLSLFHWRCSMTQMLNRMILFMHSRQLQRTFLKYALRASIVIIIIIIISVVIVAFIVSQHKENERKNGKNETKSNYSLNSFSCKPASVWRMSLRVYSLPNAYHSFALSLSLSSPNCRSIIFSLPHTLHALHSSYIVFRVLTLTPPGFGYVYLTIFTHTQHHSSFRFEHDSSRFGTTAALLNAHTLTHSFVQRTQ